MTAANKNNWGGVREGAGRPKNAEGQRQQHQVRAYPQEWELIKAFAEIVKKDAEKAKQLLMITKNYYPIILTPDKVGYVVYIPDFHINTEGDTLKEAIEMARDAICLMGIAMEDDKKPAPSPSKICAVGKEAGADDIVMLVDVDFAEYRKRL